MTDNQLREEMVNALKFVRQFYQDNFENMPVAFQSVDSYCEMVLSDEKMNWLAHHWTVDYCTHCQAPSSLVSGLCWECRHD